MRGDAAPGKFGPERALIYARGNRPGSGQYADGQGSGVGLDVQLVERGIHARIDHADNLDAGSGLAEQRLDLVEAVSCGGVAGHDDDLDLLLVTAGLFFDAVDEVAVVEQEEGVLDYEFLQIFGVVFGRIIAVGHVGLVRKIDEVFAGKVEDAVASLGSSDIVEVVEAEQLLQNGQSTGSRIEDADGQVAHFRRIIVEIHIEMRGCIVEGLVDDHGIVDRNLLLAAACRDEKQAGGRQDAGKREAAMHDFLLFIWQNY